MLPSLHSLTHTHALSVPDKPYPKVNDTKEINTAQSVFRTLASAIIAVPVIAVGALAYYYYL